MVTSEHVMEMAVRSARKVCRTWGITDTDDMIQEARIAAWRVYPQIDQARAESSVACYVSRVVRTRVRDLFTHERRSRGRDVLYHRDFSSSPERPDQLVEAANEAEAILATVDAALRSDQWESVEMALEGKGARSDAQRKVLERFRTQIALALEGQIAVDTAAVNRLLRMGGERHER